MTATRAASISHFFSRRWRGQVPLRTVFWRDMLGIGTVINVTATFVALMAAAQGASMFWTAVLHFAPLPYNLFLFAALWRRPERSLVVSVVAPVWLVIMLLI